MYEVLGVPIVPNSANLCVNCLRNTYVPSVHFRIVHHSDACAASISQKVSQNKVCISVSQYSVHVVFNDHAASVSFCRNCERFLAPPAAWTPARPESQELLAICLKKLKGLPKVRLTDAHFIWTEPHSKRLRVSLTIQKEVRVICELREERMMLIRDLGS